MGKRLLTLPLLTVLAACGGSQDAAPPATATVETTTGATTTVAPPPTSTISVYRVRNGVLRPTQIHVTGTAVAAAALDALGLPPKVKIANGRADVEATELTEEQKAEVVYTLTQFATVHAVSIGGNEPLTRADFQSYAPPILVETPAPNAHVHNAFGVAGTASVFEATVVVQLVRDGKVLDKQTVMASEGAPGRGSYLSRLVGSPGPAVVQVFSPSAVDGSHQHEVDVPVTVMP